MKKQNRDHDRWLLHQREKNRKRKERADKRRRHRNRFGPGWYQPPKAVETEETKKQVRGAEIVLPAEMDIEQNYEATVRALTKIRQASLRRLRLRYINFDNITHISPAAALLLASEVDRWNESIRGRIQSADDSWNPDIRRLLCQMGLYELLRIPRPADGADLKSTTFLPFMRGNVDERTHAGQQAQNLRKLIEEAAGIEVKKHLLSDGLTEAATNVCHHAYRKRGQRKKRYKPWWLSAAVSTKDGSVTVCFYDHGLTIPGTLPASEKMERWRHRIGAWNDGLRIRAAMTIGRSSTGKSGRGKGLKNFLELIHGHAISSLTIISRNGRLRVENVGNSRLRYRSAVLATCLQGTLIEWKFVPNTARENGSNAYLDRQ